MDAAGTAHISGDTDGFTPLPVTNNATQRNFSGGGLDAMLLRVNSTPAYSYVSYMGAVAGFIYALLRCTQSTCTGGGGFDQGLVRSRACSLQAPSRAAIQQAVVVDGSGNTYITGQTAYAKQVRHLRRLSSPTAAQLWRLECDKQRLPENPSGLL